MINIRVTIRNPWSDRFERFRTWWGATFWPHWFWEVDVFRSNDIFDFYLRVTPREDHQGIYLGLALMTWNLDISVYDGRHGPGDVFQ